MKKENYRPMSLMNIDMKIFTKYQLIKTNNKTKNSIHTEQVKFILGMVQHIKNLTNHINKPKQKSYDYLNTCKG